MIRQEINDAEIYDVLVYTIVFSVIVYLKILKTDMHTM